MSKKCLDLNLDYDMEDQQRKEAEGRIVPYREITVSLIRSAFMTNYAQNGMEPPISRQFRSIMKQLEKSKTDYVILSETDFQRIFDELHKWKPNPVQAFIVPVLLDELDIVKVRKREDEDALIEEIHKDAARSTDAVNPPVQ